jgi:hypothetical protein
LIGVLVGIQLISAHIECQDLDPAFFKTREILPKKKAKLEIEKLQKKVILKVFSC